MISGCLANIAPAISIAAMFAAAATSAAQNTAEKILVGDTKVTMIQSYSGLDKLPKPAEAIVYDFDVPADVITIDKSAGAHILNNDPIAHMKGDAGQESDPAAVAAKVQAAFSKRLVKELKKTTIPTSMAESSASSDSHVNILTVHGGFTAVNQGDKTVRMMIGFGRGASDVKAHVVVSLVTQDKPIVLAEFNLDSESGKKPGAAATMGVGSAAGSVAASGATDNKASVSGDTSRMAKAVAQEIEDIMVAQQWIAPMAGTKQPQQAQAAQ
jgi:Domain of unknown function (DUF4410)